MRRAPAEVARILEPPVDRVPARRARRDRRARRSATGRCATARTRSTAWRCGARRPGSSASSGPSSGRPTPHGQHLHGTARPSDGVSAAARRRTRGVAPGPAGPLGGPPMWPGAGSPWLPAGRLRDAQATPVPGLVALLASACAGAPRRPATPIRRRTPATTDPRRPRPSNRPPTPYDGVTYEDPGRQPVRRPDRGPGSRPSRSTSTPPRTPSPSATSATATGPIPASVRVEEWVNSFDQGYVAPEDGTFAILVDGGPTPFLDRGRGPAPDRAPGRDVRERARADAALTFVIDSPGSMAREDRLELVKDVARAARRGPAARRHRRRSSSFGDEARVVLPPTSAPRRRARSSTRSTPPAGAARRTRGRPPARLRAGPRVAHRERDRPGRPRVGRCRQRRR